MEGMNIDEYNAWIGGIARRFKQSQIKAATAVNVEMLKFYWSLGADIVRLEKHYHIEKQRTQNSTELIQKFLQTECLAGSLL